MPTLADEAQRLQRLLGYLKQDPGNVRLILDAVELGVRTGRGEEAQEWLDTALQAKPEEPSLLSAKGNLLLTLGKPRDAASVFEDLIRGAGPNSVLSFNLAHARLYEGRMQESLALLDSVPEAERGALPRFDLSYARVAYQLLRYDDALAAIDRFLTANAGDLEASGIKAMVLFDNNREEEAVAMAKALLRQSSEQWEAHLVLGSAALPAQDAAAAEIHFTKVVGQVPDAGRAWSGLGFASLMRRDLNGARERFEKAVLYMTDHPGTWHGLAWTCILLGDRGRARAAIDRSMLVDRNFADNHGTLAVLEFLQGRRTEAELAVRKALRLNPAAPSALYARSLLLDAAGQNQAAEEIVTSILSSLKGPKGPALLKMYKDSRHGGRAGAPPTPNRLH